MGKITFSPLHILFSLLGFLGGLFFCDTILGFVSDIMGTGTPTTDLVGSLFVNAGVGIIVAVILVLFSLFLIKKFIGFIIAIFLGILACLILASVGVILPDPASLIFGCGILL